MSNNIITTINEKQYQINKTTGEATELMTVTLPIGSKWQTPKQQAAVKQWKEYQEAKKLKQQYISTVKSRLGNFYFILTDNVFLDVSPQTATRLIMLCTYLNYSNQFMRTNKTPMAKSDIQTILKLSKTAVNKFWNEVRDKYIIDRNNGLYINNNANIFRNKIPKNNQYLQYQKIYINTVRALYKVTHPRKHKQLGYIFKLLPYINLEYNIFCTDAFEQELNQIKPLSMTDFCKLINCDIGQASRLQKDLKSLTFDYQGNQERLLSYVDDGNNTPHSKKIFVNPHIIYNGSDYKRVEILGIFYNTDNKSTRHFANS